MSNQSSDYNPPRRIVWQSGVQPPGTQGVPNQSSSFRKFAGIQTVREIDGDPSIDADVLEVSNGTLTEPSPGIARVTTGGGGGSIRVRETDGSPDIDPTTIITVPADSLTNPSAGEAELSFNNYEMREVTLVFSATVAAGTAINIQTGVYGGAGSPAMVKDDLNVTLPTSGILFKGDGRIEVSLNGQELDKGDGTGNGVAEWVSTTQIKLSLKLKNNGMLKIRAPFPTA